VEEKQQGPYRKGRADRGREEMPTSSCGKWRGLRLLACNYREIQMAANNEGCYHGNRTNPSQFTFWKLWWVLIASLLSFVKEIRSSESA
jgi:hypothetical protein